MFINSVFYYITLEYCPTIRCFCIKQMLQNVPISTSEKLFRRARKLFYIIKKLTTVADNWLESNLVTQFLTIHNFDHLITRKFLQGCIINKFMFVVYMSALIRHIGYLQSAAFGLLMTSLFLYSFVKSCLALRFVISISIIVVVLL